MEEKWADHGFVPSDSQEWRRICLFGQGTYDAPHGRVLYAVVRALRPRRILEIGTGRGFSALAMALAQRDAGLHDGRILTIDVIAHGRLQHWHNPRRHVKDDPAAVGPISRKELLKDFGGLIDGRVEFETGSSLEKLASLPQGSMHFAFIDGDHSLVGVSRDWEYVRRILAPQGSVAFDDYDAGTDLGEILSSRILRNIRGCRRIGGILRSGRLPSWLSRDQHKYIRKVLFPGVHRVVERIYAEGSWNLEVFPYLGSLSIALLIPTAVSVC